MSSNQSFAGHAEYKTRSWAAASGIFRSSSRTTLDRRLRGVLADCDRVDRLIRLTNAIDGCEREE